jgi:hypothetical protein
MRSPWLLAWLNIGNRNPWIREADDPPFNEESFCECATIEGLKERLLVGNWCLGQAFYLGRLCFINQVDGGDEWLTIRDDLPFESLTAVLMIQDGSFDRFLADVNAATDEQLRSLTYSQKPEVQQAVSA